MRRLSCLMLGLVACDRAPAAEAPEAPAPARAETPAPGPAEPLEPEAPEPAPEPEGVPGGGPDPMELNGSASVSVGSPTEGHLTSSVPLPTSGPGYVFNPRKDPSRRFGTWELVRAIIDASAAAQEAHPGNTLVVGDLSLAAGGDINGHASHRAGRDVDVMFYLQNPDGTPFDAKAIPIEPDGSGVDYKDLTTADDDVHVRIDVPRTWAFIGALVGDDRNHIGRIFVVEHVRTMLLEEGARVGADKAVLERVGHLMCQPKFPHDDHMHIRMFCSPEDIAAGCLDTAPIFPWHKKFLESAGVSATWLELDRRHAPSSPAPRTRRRRSATRSAPLIRPSMGSWSGEKPGPRSQRPAGSTAVSGVAPRRTRRAHSAAAQLRTRLPGWRRRARRPRRRGSRPLRR